MELIHKWKFAKGTLNKECETFVVYVIALEALELAIATHSSRPPLLVAVRQGKASTEIPSEYTGYADVFFLDLAMELLKKAGINEHAIKPIEGNQSPYGYIYSPASVELKTLKAYIENYLKTGFI